VQYNIIFIRRIFNTNIADKQYCDTPPGKNIGVISNYLKKILKIKDPHHLKLGGRDKQIGFYKSCVRISLFKTGQVVVLILFAFFTTLSNWI